jgi:hypothetical protein
MGTINLTRQEQDITIDQGSNVTINFTLTRANQTFDMTGYTLALQVRRNITDATPVLSCTDANGLMTWTNQTLGQFALTLTAAATNAIVFKTGETAIDGVYDLEITDAAGNVSKPCGGSFTINMQVTR